jgi:hypothetical protein
LSLYKNTSRRKSPPVRSIAPQAQHHSKQQALVTSVRIPLGEGKTRPLQNEPILVPPTAREGVVGGRKRRAPSPGAESQTQLAELKKDSAARVVAGQEHGRLFRILSGGQKLIGEFQSLAQLQFALPSAARYAFAVADSAPLGSLVVINAQGQDAKQIPLVENYNVIQTLAANRAYRSLGEGARTIEAHRQPRIASTDLVNCAWASTSTSPVTWPQNPRP